MEYKVFYDIQQIFYPAWWVFALALIPFASGVFNFFTRRHHDIDPMQETYIFSKHFPYLLPILFGILIVAFGLANYSIFAGLREKARSGDYQVIEGKVRDFLPQTNNRRRESFTVGNQSFSYADWDLTKGYHQSMTNGGVIRDGMQVRIAYVNDSILKLEVAKE